MKTIKEDYLIIDNLVDLSYFETHGETITGAYNTQSSWRRAAEGTYILVYNISYQAGNQKNNKYLVSYSATLQQQCIFDDIDSDVAKIIEIKQKMHISLRKFLEDNCQSFFHLLKFELQEFTQDSTIREKASIYRVMDAKPFEELSQIEREMEEFHYGQNVLKIVVNE